MARTVRDANLQTREARRRLKAQGKPHWRTIEEGLHLGYRKPKSGSGKWVLRHYVGAQAYKHEIIGSADDQSDADGDAILDFRQAQERARGIMVDRARAAAGKHGPVTVADAIEAYLQFLEENKKSGQDARHSAAAFILPRLGKVELAELTTEMINRWRVELAKAPARLRGKAGAPPRHREADSSEEGIRQRRNTANRVWSILRAALNYAWREGKTPSDAGWRRVKPFAGVSAARVRFLTLAEAKRRINASDPDFTDMVRAALFTGCRYGELCRFVVADFNPDAGTIAVHRSKAGKPRHVVLTDEGAEFFAQLCAGRPAAEILIRKSHGGAWGKSHQPKPMARACRRAGIEPPINFHGLRHTYASLAVMNGAPLAVVARNLGHVDTTMVERHYGHMSASYIADTVRKTAPKFGFKPARNVTPLR